jgi:hypothetical protein
MKRFKFVGLALMAAFAFTAIAAATASAAATLPNVLPAGSASEPVNFTGSSAKTTFGDGIEKVTSEASTSTASGNAAKSGTFNVLFKESKDILGTTCTGLNSGETSGDISVSGTFHVVDYGTKDEVGNTFLLKTVHFSCGSSILVIVQGCVAGAITTPVNTLSKTLTVQLTAKSGDNEIIKVFNTENTAEENCELKASQNEAEFKLSSQEQKQVSLGFKKGSTAEEILVMPL